MEKIFLETIHEHFTRDDIIRILIRNQNELIDNMRELLNEKELTNTTKLL